MQPTVGGEHAANRAQATITAVLVAPSNGTMTEEPLAVRGLSGILLVLTRTYPGRWA